MSKNILLIEDDKQIIEIMKDYFNHSGFNVYMANDGLEGIEIFEREKIDVVTIDVMLPKLDGWSVCTRIRNKSEVPIIMLTARGEDDDQLLGFQIGADDYVVKPFSNKVLVARVEALLARKTSNREINKESSETLSMGGIELNDVARIVKVENVVVDLAPKEYALLSYFMINRGRVLSRENLLSKIWGYTYFGETRAVDTYVKKLRKKLGNKSELIITITGIGYKFEV